MKKVYGLYRDFWDTRGNKYPPTYFLAKQFLDLAQAQIIGLEDKVIPEARYTGEVAPGIITMRRFITGTYDETKISETDFKAILANVSGMNDIVIFPTIEEARQWIRDKTDLPEDTTIAGKFETYPVSELETDSHPAIYLTID